jgi:hypothetical protein
MCNLHKAEDKGVLLNPLNRAQASVPRLSLTLPSATRLVLYARNVSKLVGNAQATLKYGRKERRKAARLVLDVCTP